MRERANRVSSGYEAALPGEMVEYNFFWTTGKSTDYNRRMIVYKRVSNNDGNPGKVQVYRSSDTRIVGWETFFIIVALSAMMMTATALHPAIAIVISLVVGLFAYALFQTRVGFWVLTLFYTGVWTTIAFRIMTNLVDLTWTVVVSGFVALMSFGAHMNAKKYFDNVEEV